MKFLSSNVKKLVVFIYYYIVQGVTFVFPNHAIFNKVRGFLLKPCFKKAGKGIQIGKYVILNCIWNITLGDGVYIAYHCYINGVGGLEIGANTIISPMCIISTSNHKFNDEGVTHEGIVKEIKIGEGSYIAGHCTINSGVTIGNCVKIGGNSLVIKDVKDNQFVSGVPAREVK